MRLRGRDTNFVIVVGMCRAAAFLARKIAARRRGTAPLFGLETPAGRRCHPCLLRTLRLEGY